MKTSELIGPALDYSVAKCEAVTLAEHIEGNYSWLEHEVTGNWVTYSPSTDWSQGGPIICREITKVFRNVSGTWSAMILKDVPIPPEDRGTSLALTRRAQWNGAGPTPLIAAMRCLVASRIGDEVEIPEELCK